jgi:hypothetical protein
MGFTTPPLCAPVGKTARANAGRVNSGTERLSSGRPSEGQLLWRNRCVDVSVCGCGAFCVIAALAVSCYLRPMYCGFRRPVLVRR